MSETSQPEGVAVERVVMRLRELSRARWDRDAWERETTVRIPAEPERDIDLVLSNAADLIEQSKRCEEHDCGKCITPGDARKLVAENKRLRAALAPMVRGTYWINSADVARAAKALGLQPNPGNNPPEGSG